MNWFQTITETQTVTKTVYVGPLSEWLWIGEIALPILTIGIVYWGMTTGAFPRP